MNLIIIRCCPKDDELAYRCYTTFKDTGIEAEYLFFAENGKYPLCIQTKENFYFRPWMDNFCGRSNVIPYIEHLRKIDVSIYDMIILSDADIIVNKNPLDHHFDFGGIRDATNHRHFSGQMLIFSKSIFTRLMTYDRYEETMEYFINNTNYSIVDDTILSWVATEDKNITTFDFNGLNYWVHTKAI